MHCFGALKLVASSNSVVNEALLSDDEGVKYSKAAFAVAIQVQVRRIRSRDQTKGRLFAGLSAS